MSSVPITLPLLRLGRLELNPGLRALQPGSATADLVVTATVEAPESVSERQYAWDVAWADAVREAGALGADQRTAQALAAVAARRPAHVVLLADRDGAAVIAHTAGDLHPARRYEASARPGMQPDPHPDRPPAQHHGERHVTEAALLRRGAAGRI
jgi:hypothetical protein